MERPPSTLLLFGSARVFDLRAERGCAAERRRRRGPPPGAQMLAAGSRPSHTRDPPDAGRRRRGRPRRPQRTHRRWLFLLYGAPFGETPSRRDRRLLDRKALRKVLGERRHRRGGFASLRVAARRRRLSPVRRVSLQTFAPPLCVLRMARSRRVRPRPTGRRHRRLATGDGSGPMYERIRRFRPRRDARDSRGRASEPVPSTHASGARRGEARARRRRSLGGGGDFPALARSSLLVGVPPIPPLALARALALAARLLLSLIHI